MDRYCFYGWETANVQDSRGLTPREMYDLLSGIWCAETCAPRMRPDWSAENKTLGQCSITAFLMQDLYGGKVYGVPLGDGNYHCFNDVDGCVFDLTSEQFGGKKLDYSRCPEQFREVHFAKAEKRQRYEYLKERLLQVLEERACAPDAGSPQTEQVEDAADAGHLQTEQGKVMPQAAQSQTCKGEISPEPVRQQTRQGEVPPDQSIQRVRRFRENLMTPFTKAIRTYDLLQPGDRVAVCISGGKDSMLMARLFQELQRHRKFPFELVFLVMDPGYTPENRKLIEQNAAYLNIPVEFFESGIFDAVDEIPKSPCYLCARMRRGHLYKQAQLRGCNKIALGHHYDDVIETILMGLMWSGQFQTMMPKVRSKNFPGMELIRPMTLIRESEILAWRDYHHLRFLQCACHFTEAVARPDTPVTSKRQETKELIRKLHETNPDIEAHLFNSVRCVNLDTVLGYKRRGEEHSFLDDY